MNRYLRSLNCLSLSYKKPWTSRASACDLQRSGADGYVLQASDAQETLCCMVHTYIISLRYITPSPLPERISVMQRTVHATQQSSAPSVRAAKPYWTRSYPFVSLHLAITLLRIGVAGLFIAHAAVRLLKTGSLAQFGAAMNAYGLPMGVAVVWALTVFELVAGALMLVGYRTKYLAAGFMTIMIGGIVIIHAKLGWFVGEHGSGGSEYSVALMLALLVLAAADSKPSSVAHVA
jgi:putative oxidoreductase